ncbi:DNA-binding MarR family transcriptional regulator [Nakamurella sp. UYEF19]|uniref:MarR family winged helix-turn-helix transcriptional regulator n=1 Tax=Nakamurella sp. UYEF19 TaxID=1756392 RepID=UPI003394CC1E
MSSDAESAPAGAGTTGPSRPTGAGFRLAQVGAHGAARFADRLRPLGLTPPQAGILRAISAEPGRSQNAVAGQLGLHPSRLVVLIDDLEREGLVERRRSVHDRRHSALHLTEQAGSMMGRLGRVAAEHEADLCTALTADERNQLAGLLRRIADQQGLTPAVHPGFGHITASES